MDCALARPNDTQVSANDKPRMPLRYIKWKSEWTWVERTRATEDTPIRAPSVSERIATQAFAARPRQPLAAQRAPSRARIGACTDPLLCRPRPPAILASGHSSTYGSQSSENSWFLVADLIELIQARPYRRIGSEHDDWIQPGRARSGPGNRTQGVLHT